MSSTEREKPDEVDRGIIERLRKNACTTFVEIGKALALRTPPSLFLSVSCAEIGL